LISESSRCRAGGATPAAWLVRIRKAAPELAATANISAFNIANALGGLIGGAVVDSSFGANAIPFAAAIVPVVGLLFILYMIISLSYAGVIYAGGANACDLR
jgi:predicted MFS family arabinose efflux permease